MSSRCFLRDSGGATIVEFALVAPLLLMFLVGGINLSLLGFSIANLKYAAEAGARCASVNSTICTNGTTTAERAASEFMQLTAAPANFQADFAAACGKKVTGSMTFVINTGLARIDVPLTSTACFP